MKAALLVFVMIFFAGLESVKASDDLWYKGPASWQEFEKAMHDQEQKDRITGMSYMISGTVATIGGLAGYYSAEDAFSKGAFAISQTLGVAALGYGAATYFNGNEYNSFYRAVRDSHLSEKQRTELLQHFLDEEHERKDRERWIRAATHFALGVMNLYSASHESNTDVKGVFQFMGAVNIVMGFSYSFD